MRNGDVVIPRTYYCPSILLFLTCKVCNKFFKDTFRFLLYPLFLWSPFKSETVYVDVVCHLCRIKDRSVCTLEWGFWINGVKEKGLSSTSRKLFLILRTIFCFLCYTSLAGLYYWSGSILSLHF